MYYLEDWSAFFEQNPQFPVFFPVSSPFDSCRTVAHFFRKERGKDGGTRHLVESRHEVTVNDD
jgi:hypothetical protein